MGILEVGEKRSHAKTEATLVELMVRPTSIKDHGFKECPMCGMKASNDGSWKSLERQMHMMKCNPVVFREELEQDHEFQVFLALKGIKWFYSQNGRPLSKRQKLLKEVVVSKEAVQSEKQKREELGGSKQASKQKLPCKVPAREGGNRRKAISCACGLDIYAGDCLQCESCYHWRHRLCEGVTPKRFNKARSRAAVIFICHACASKSSSWTRNAEAVCGERRVFQKEELKRLLKLEASKDEQHFFQVPPPSGRLPPSADPRSQPPRTPSANKQTNEKPKSTAEVPQQTPPATQALKRVSAVIQTGNQQPCAVQSGKQTTSTVQATKQPPPVSQATKQPLPVGQATKQPPPVGQATKQPPPVGHATKQPATASQKRKTPASVPNLAATFMPQINPLNPQGNMLLANQLHLSQWKPNAMQKQPAMNGQKPSVATSPTENKSDAVGDRKQVPTHSPLKLAPLHPSGVQLRESSGAASNAEKATGAVKSGTDQPPMNAASLGWNSGIQQGYPWQILPALQSAPGLIWTPPIVITGGNSLGFDFSAPGMPAFMTANANQTNAAQVPKQESQAAAAQTKAQKPKHSGNESVGKPEVTLVPKEKETNIATSKTPSKVTKIAPKNSTFEVMQSQNGPQNNLISKPIATDGRKSNHPGKGGSSGTTPVTNVPLLPTGQAGGSATVTSFLNGANVATPTIGGSIQTNQQNKNQKKSTSKIAAKGDATTLVKSNPLLAPAKVDGQQGKSTTQVASEVGIPKIERAVLQKNVAPSAPNALLQATELIKAADGTLPTVTPPIIKIFNGPGYKAREIMNFWQSKGISNLLTGTNSPPGAPAVPAKEQSLSDHTPSTKPTPSAQPSATITNSQALTAPGMRDNKT